MIERVFLVLCLGDVGWGIGWCGEVVDDVGDGFEVVRVICGIGEDIFMSMVRF